MPSWGTCCASSPREPAPGLCAGWGGGTKQLLLKGRTTQVWVRGLGAWGDAAESPGPSSPGEAISLPPLLVPRR